ncbi:MAG: hypothetical protein L3K16_07255 [Thermoplasmata archaeon]|nr:hypothetical protein [Thermoplasmata archaeon]
MATRPAYAPRTVLRPPRRAVASPLVRRRSHAAIPVALGVMVVGLVLASDSVLLAVFLGLALLGAALSFLSTRLNPLSVGFYLPVKPSWSAIGVVALGGLVLFATVYLAWVHGTAQLVPGVRVPKP